MVIAKVIQADVLATWQDFGRVRSVHHGVGQGGVMDFYAASWANRLLGRDIDLPVIEITMGLFALEFKSNCQIAITGAAMGLSLNNQPIKNWQSYAVKVGDQLKFAPATQGLRSYLAIKADIELETIFNSASTVIREQFSGLLGRPLRINDELTGSLPTAKRAQAIVEMPSSLIPNYCEPLNLELIPSYQFDRFPAESINKLLNSEFQILPSSSRIAYLLQGDPVQHEIESLASEGIAYGAVQVPPDGQPIILLNDRQTMGGYPKLGCVSRVSGAALSQRFAPTKIKFKLTTLEAATRAIEKMLEFFKENPADQISASKDV
ncbi:MAG: biotin-dependent carboxyltransferase family protein [Acidiferrobacterales bacterium]|nr:biotin-dependent carboxyltransferase family protein [Acidiferrobacterales bacterium]